MLGEWTKDIDFVQQKTGPNGYFFPEIDPARWCQVWPYQLVLIELRENRYFRHGAFTLPIPPQSLDLEMPIAEAATATIGGIAEDHSGAPFRMINLSGTTGVAPFRRSTAAAPSAAQRNVAGSVAAGTIQATGNVVQALNTLLTDPRDVPETSTGYYQFHLLQRFLESYLTLKQAEHGKNFRLAFAMWKDNSIYLVTPQRFNLRRNAQHPREYTYQLVLKAWRRIDLQNGMVKAQPPVSVQTLTGDVFQKLFQARLVLQSAARVVDGVTGDWNRILNVVRQGGLLAKDAAGLGYTILDFPEKIQDSLIRLDADLKAYDAARDPLKRGESDRRTGRVAGTDAPMTRNPKPDLERLNQVPVSRLRLEGALLAAVNGEIRSCRGMTRGDLEERRNLLLDAAADLADSIGMGSEVYNRTYGRKAAVKKTSPTPDQLAVLAALQEAAWQFDRLIATRPAPENRAPASLEYVAQLAREAGVEFVVPRSQFAIPFPYGGSLEGLAAQYLGTPDRWHEIATLNKLRAPYVDETGFELPLVFNGSGDTVTVKSAKELYVGQVCWLRSNVRNQERYTISGIEETAGGWQIRLTGAEGLERFRTDNQAVLHAYLPGTVNAQQMIFIPRPDDAPADLLPRFVPSGDQQDALLRVGGVDLLLDQQGDLVLTEGGAVYSYGMANILQVIRIALTTERGSVLRHPEFGVGVEPGSSLADFNASTLAAHIRGLFADDPAFLGVEDVRVEQRGGRASLEMAVRLNGVDQVLPISLDIRP
jgi:hypothetical protein